MSPSRAWLVFALTGLGATPALSQDTAVVFVHGIQSNSSVWDFPLQTIQPGLRVNPVRPDLGWTRFVSDQVVELSSYVNSHPATDDPGLRMPFMARSAGGLVTRDYSRVHGRVRQLATIATPHQGAFLANTWRAYMVLDVAFYMMDALFAPITFYENEDADNPEIITWAYTAMYPFWLFANGLDAALCPHLGLCVVFDGVNNVIAPIAHDLSEGSAVTDYEWGRLNNQTNLAREAGGPNGIGRRVGLWVDATAEGVVFDLVGLYRPDWIDGRRRDQLLHDGV